MPACLTAYVRILRATSGLRARCVLSVEGQSFLCVIIVLPLFVSAPDTTVGWQDHANYVVFHKSDYRQASWSLEKKTADAIIGDQCRKFGAELMATNSTTTPIRLAAAIVRS